MINAITAQKVNIREYLRNYKKYNSQLKLGKKFLLTSKNEIIAEMNLPTNIKKKFNIEDFEKLRFKANKNLSRDVDKIVYGL